MFLDDPYAVAYEPPTSDIETEEKAFPKQKSTYLNFIGKKNQQLRQGKISIKKYKKEVKKFKTKKYWN